MSHEDAGTRDPQAGSRPGAENHGMLMGFFAGLLVGVGVGLLLAPKPGSEVRRTVATSAGDLRRRASETLQHSQTRMSHAVELGRDAYSRARHIVNRTRPHAAEAGHEAVQEASPPAQSLRERATTDALG